MIGEYKEFVIDSAMDRLRLDRALSIMMSDYSRSRIQQWIKDGQVKVDGEVIQLTKYQVVTGQRIELVTKPAAELSFLPEPLKLEIIHEDCDLIVLNKQVGTVVHPGAGNYEHTLLNALIFYYPELTTLPRAGIVHRLDKDTSGIMVVARNLAAHYYLTKQLQERKVKREYVAVVHGLIISGGTINENIGRHPFKRTMMSVKKTGKIAITHYRVIEKFEHYTYLKLQLETGRTHQLRVHLSYLGYPIVGDQCYSNRTKVIKQVAAEVKKAIESFPRQALHALKLELVHPGTNQLVSWKAPIATDIGNLLKTLRANR